MKRFIVMVSIFAIISSLCQVSASAESLSSYTYSYEGDTEISPNAYTAEYEVSDFGLDKSLDKPQDMVCDKDGYRIFIADTSNNRIVVLNNRLEQITQITEYPDKSGNVLSFSEPQGVFFTNDNYLYVADTNNTNIVVFDNSYKYVRTIYAPSSDSYPADFTYKPKSVAVDGTGRIYVISLNTNMGVIALNKDGEFQRFIGAQRVNATFAELVKRMFMSDEQIERSASFVPMEYSNLTIDSKGFLYVTSSQIDRYSLYSAVWSRSGDSTYAPIKKINPSGTDVLRRNGFFPPVGNIGFDAYESADEEKRIDPSQLTEVTLQNYGMYTLVDSEGNRVYTYDSYGNLLYAFGGTGESLGLFNKLCSVIYIGDKMYALDSMDGAVTVFSKTEYGAMIDKVISYQENRRYDKERKMWQQILNKNNNFDLAYFGIGKTYLENGQYSDALQYFKLINNKTYYSRAFKLLRQEFLAKYGMLILVLAVAAIIALIKFFGFANKYNNRHRQLPARGKFRDEFLFAFYTMFHPLNGFYEGKREKRASARAASAILGLGVLAYVIKDFAGGYLLKADGTTSILSSIIGLLLPVGLWCVANWCLTSLMDGNGKMRDIFVVTCYSLMPMILCYVITTFLGHFMVADELTFLAFAINLCVFWTLLLVFFGTMTVHEYSFGRNIITVALSLVAVGIILFILMIFFSLSGRIVSLVNNIINEISFRS